MIVMEKFIAQRSSPVGSRGGVLQRRSSHGNEFQERKHQWLSRKTNQMQFKGVFAPRLWASTPQAISKDRPFSRVQPSTDSPSATGLMRRTGLVWPCRAQKSAQSSVPIP